MKKLWKVILSAVLLMSSLTIMPKTQIHAEIEADHQKISDEGTVNSWEELFSDDSTEHAGGIWTDKSVFNSASDYVAKTSENETAASIAELAIDEDNFLVSLSAIASTKSVVGYSNVPTDTILVLDMSTSMINNRSVDELAYAANKAMQELLALNNHNRVGVVVYAGNTTGRFDREAIGATDVLLPLDRYTATNDVYGPNDRKDGVNDFLHFSKDKNSEWNNIYVVEGVKNSNNENVQTKDKTTSSGTFIQDGIYVALQQFLNVPQDDVTIKPGEIQAGADRLPIMVIMTDGEPTLAVTDFDGENGTLGKNELNYADHGYDDITFLSQLTASYAKYAIDQHYNESPLFYTLGLNVDEDVALVMNPDPEYPGANQNLIARFNRYWNDLTTTGRTRLEDSNIQLSYNASFMKDTLQKYRSYSDGYYRAGNEQGLITAFDNIVKEIILQSLYYPTLIEDNLVHADGYLTFIDYIGHYMEIKDVKGLQFGEEVYTGEKFARFIVTGSAGTEQNPTELGDNVIWALTERLGLERNTANIQAVRQLVHSAYIAGQISYNASTGAFSNYVGWFGDASGKYVAFWDGTQASIDAIKASNPNVVSANKSYLFLDGLGEGHRETDVLYASVQVSEAIKGYTSGRGVDVTEGETMMYGRLPASLIPLIEYNVTLNSDNPEDIKNFEVSGTDYPTRLLYEVGLSDDVDVLNLSETAAAAKETRDSDPNKGKYVFYTNQYSIWSSDQTATGEPWLHNAYAMYEPSEENEHYFYNENTPVYTDRAGTRATSIVSGTEYYHRYLIYKYDGTTYSSVYEYVPISPEVLADSKNYASDSTGVYVKKGVIHRYFTDHIVSKGTNTTNTVAYSSYPYVHLTPDSYHVDDVLGNNGKLIVDPYEGIKLTKRIDSSLNADNTLYQFTIKIENNTSLETFVMVNEDVDGNRVYGTLEFVNGSAAVSLKANETLYVLGNSSHALSGMNVTVTETETENYEVSKIVVNDQEIALPGNSTQFTVADDAITAVEFTNKKVVTGDVIVEKTVISDHESHKTDKEFIFEITLNGNGKTLQDEYPATLIKTNETGVERVPGKIVKDSTNYKFQADGQSVHPYGVSLRHNDYLHIEGLEDGVIVSANEVSLPNGFSVDAGSSTTTATVSIGQVKEIHFVNQYHADSVTLTDYDLKITKNLSDTNFTSSDVVFTFQLQQLNADNHYVDVAGGTYTMTFNKGSANTQELVRDLSFTFEQPGRYSYRVIEVPSSAYPGIIYDPAEAFFTVEVKDDGNGQLVVNDVYAGTDTTISGNVISTTFNNQFIITGAAEVVLNISKTMNDFGTGANIPLSDFEFTVHEVATADGTADNSNIIATIKSNGEGHAVFSRVFSQSLDEAYKLKTHYYVIKEVNKGNMSYPGTVGYDTTEYRVTVEAGSTSTSTSGVVSPTMIVYVNGQQVYPTSSSISTVAEGDNILIANVGLSFANTYTPNSVHLTIPVSGIKTLKGYPDGVNLPEFTFIISKSDENGNVIDNTSLTKTVQGSGTFVFTDLVDDPLTAENEATTLFSYNKTGNYYYVVEETAGTNAGIAYDNAKYLVTVSVTSDHLGGLTATMTKVQDLLAAGAPEAVIEFVNTYAVDNAEVVLKGKKTLVSDLWTLNPNTFSFNLYETTDTFDTTGLTPVQTTTNGLGNDAGAFQFALNYGEAGKHYYVIEEVVPSGIDSNNKLNGITYDVTKYQVTVDVKDQGTGELIATVTGLDSNNLASFTNKYDVASTTAIIKGSKHIDGALLDALYQGTEFFNFFEFELYHAEVVHGEWTSQGSLIKTTKIKEVKSDGTGYFEFTENYTKPGDYYYIVTEKFVNSDPSIVYDPATYHVRVNVVDNLDGHLKANVSYAMVGNSSSYAEVVFRNIVHPEEIVLTDIGGTKQLTGWNFDSSIEKPEFTFELYQSNAEGQRVDVNTGTPELEPLLSTTVKGSGNFVFTDVEDDPATTGVNEATHYLKFSGPGTYYYLIAEKIPVDAVNNVKNAVTYDPSEYLVKVVVTMNDAENNSTHRDYFTYTVSYSSKGNAVDKDDIKFKNEFDANEAEVVFKGKKTLIGREIQDSEFVFGLYPADASGNITGNTPAFTGCNVGDTFEVKAVFDEPGEFHYVLKEQKGNNPTITYDDGEVLVRVIVSYDDATGAFVADTDVFVDNRWDALEYFNSDFQFVNTYTPTLVFVNIQKILEITGTGTHGLAGFEFMLEEKNGHTGTLTPSNAEGKAGFILVFNETHLGTNNSEKKYEFVLTETDQNETGMTYDKKKVEISLVVKLNQEGKLIVTAEGSDVPLSEVSATFTNTYKGTEDVPEKPVDPTPTPVVPNTGDDGNIMGYGLLMGVAALLMALLFIMKKRKTEK